METNQNVPAQPRVRDRLATDGVRAGRVVAYILAALIAGVLGLALAFILLVIFIG